MKLSAGSLGGILLVYKEAGLTSFDVVGRIRRLCGLRKVGHMGTLDPFATGLLPVALGRSTGIIRYTGDYDKAYRVVIGLGQATDTQDLTGAPVPVEGDPLTEERMVAWLANDAAFLRQKILDMEGEQWQVPPMYSAVKIKGEPLYKYARRGETVERAARRINVYSARLIDVEKVTGPAPLRLTADFHVSKGTYIRTLAASLGEELGCGAHAIALTRTLCGPYDLADALKLNELAATWSVADFEAEVRAPHGPLLSPETAVSKFPVLKLSLQEARDLLQGKRLSLSDERLEQACSDQYLHFTERQPGPVAEPAIAENLMPLPPARSPMGLLGSSKTGFCLEGARFRAVAEQDFIGVVKIREISGHRVVVGAERMFTNLDDYKC